MNCPSCRTQMRDDAEACFTCGRALHALIMGTVLAERYEILSVLGRGGMGTVYKAHDGTLEEDVAIKVLRPDVARDPMLARRFRSEIKLARRVSHRNVCRIYEYGEDGALRYISMQYIDGVDLRSILQSTSLDRTQAFGVALQVALGLQAVHEIGIIHRDLKSSNVMIDSKGVARLLDFGIAKEAGAEITRLTVAGKLFGTPEYMSPEHARGAEVDFRSDVYSLGCLIHEIFTRRVPFHGENAAATIVKHLHDPPAFGTLIPDPLAPVLRRALAKEPSDRYPGLAEMIQALDHARLACESDQRPIQVDDDQGITRPVEQPEGLGPAYGAMWRRTDTGRLVPFAQPASSAATTGGLEWLLRAGRWRGQAWRWAIPIVLLAVAVVAGRQVISLPREQAPLVESPVARAAPPRPTTTLPSAATAFADAPPPRQSPPAPVTGSTAAGPSTAVTVDRPSPRKSFSPPAVSEMSPLPSRPATSSQPTPRPSTPPAKLVAARTTPTPAMTAAASSLPPAVPARVQEAAVPAAADVEPAPSGALEDVATPPATGVLKLVVIPEAPVMVDGEPIGPVATRELSLEPGPHAVRILHPDYEPLQRKVTIREGATTALVLDLAEKAIRKN